MTPTDANATLTDEDLVRQLKAGETENAMTQLDLRYGKRIYRFVQGMVRDPHLAHDVTQEVFEKVLLKHDLYRLGTNFRAWLFEVARNQALTMLRARNRLPKPISALNTNNEEGDFLDTVPAKPENEALVEEEFMTAFQKAVDDLPEHYSVVFDLCVRKGRPYQEAGKELGLPTGTVAIRIMRARKKLFTALQHHLGRLRRPPACFQ
ncbi:MAG: RNA polymerase sigma factor (sigma-70 family) [Planctomycetota bacterium]|jgi:RNA polymerase sigma factor (sigma-70 family)